MEQFLFGDKSRFAVEIEIDIARSRTHLFGLFYYWIEDRRIGTGGHPDLSDAMGSMKWVVHDCGRREGKGLCHLSPLAITKWFQAIYFAETENIENILRGFDFYTNDLPRDVAKFNLLFSPLINGSQSI